MRPKKAIRCPEVVSTVSDHILNMTNLSNDITGE